MLLILIPVFIILSLTTYTFYIDLYQDAVRYKYFALRDKLINLEYANGYSKNKGYDFLYDVTNHMISYSKEFDLVGVLQLTEKMKKTDESKGGKKKEIMTAITSDHELNNLYIEFIDITKSVVIRNSFILRVSYALICVYDRVAKKDVKIPNTAIVESFKAYNNLTSMRHALI